MGTPIRLTKNRFVTPASIQRRRALALVNQNSHPLPHWSSSDGPAAVTMNREAISKQDESVVLEAPDEDLPHVPHIGEDPFDDLMAADERIERLMLDSAANGVNMFAFDGGIENTIRCQSPTSSRLDLSTLLDMLN